VLDGFPAQTMLMPRGGPEKQICTGRLSFPYVADAHPDGHAMLRAMKLIIRWLLLAAALLLVAHLYSGVKVENFGEAMLAAFVIGLFNTLVRPLLVLLTLPITLLTLGLFLFVINALMFWWAASMLDGFSVTGFGAALIGSLIYSLCSMVIDAAMERVFSRPV
jgi:putative membrane protein